MTSKIWSHCGHMDILKDIYLFVQPVGSEPRLGCDVIGAVGVIGPGVFGVAGAVEWVGDPKLSSYIESLTIKWEI